MDMKIERVESILAGNSQIVRIFTDNGLVGVGQSACWGYLEATDAVVKKFADYMVGKDPLDIEHHWQYMYRMGPFRGSVLSGAVSAVDIALWDIKGKALEAPVWQLLGGKVRNKIRLHLLMGSVRADVATQGTSAEGLLLNARDAAEEGFTAIKTDPLPDGFQSMTLPRLIHDTRENVAAMREGAGLDVDIILEIHRKLTPMVAIALAEQLVEFQPAFYEDPVQIDSIKSQAEVAQRTTLPVANGERMHSIWEFREMFEAGGSQYARPDLGLAGGVTAVKKIAAIAESYHSALVTHNFLGPVLTAAACNMDAAIPNFLTQEYSKEDEQPFNAGFNSSWKREGGYIPVPDTPGIGIDLEVESFRAQPYNPRNLQVIPIREDGSIGYSV
ncbi:MAG: mandelate racemase/muconate lactonizing enzyme family protein [Dehalococcoidia bacterium]|jgi:galactonate dehydratase|nr:galactokinase [Chloroflexota bacterium]MDP6055218.1 mandelate racemase/muconate lactonizing enzyme family protein [Dehalococcoidia bacterium]MDP7484855.1 mandelate racemase/muconate lactonizing enzyme family protein [Dehalococcoidia bacterium]|tara:strand:- start:17564 stop:18724 length:1161 start_codon:yes stop_codon:yes gene_type:complete